MASNIEHCSVAWSGHAINCSVTFAKLLQRMDLADVTLIANDVKIKVHRFVLSALSSYFDELFADMPFNERAFVVLKDVSQQTLNDLITFIYHGNVKVKRENLKDFFIAAKSLKIKGLTDAESSFANTLGTATSHTASQFQTTETICARSLEKVSSSNNYRQSDQIQGHGNAILSIKMENDKDNRQLVGMGAKADDGHNETNNNDNKAMEQVQQLAVKRERPSQSDHANETMPKAKRIKQLNRKELIGYNVVADIRTMPSGRENLFYANYKFTRGKMGALGHRRWPCTRTNVKCRAAMSTLEIGGITMMKVLIDEHSH